MSTYPQPTRPGGVLLVASSGGHLLQLVQLLPVWQQFERAWVTFPKTDARSLLSGERVYWAYHPTNRHLGNLLRNALLAVWILWRERPRMIISTGAGVAIPFCYLGRLLGSHIVYIESFARVQDRSLTGRVVKPIAHRFLVQWPQLLELYPGSEYYGAVYEFAQEEQDTAGEAGS